MSEWTVFGVIVAIVGFIFTVVAPIIKLNTTLVEFTTQVKQIAADLSALTERNAKTHERIFEQLGDHEKRITTLEAHEDQ